MGTFRGAAALVWTDTDDTTTERVLLLREPLRELQPAINQSVFVADSLDKQNRQTFTIGEGVDELVGKIRFQDNPQGALDFIKAGAKQRTVTYIPDLRDADRRYACVLISPIAPATPSMDSDRGISYGELEIDIRLRKTDKTPFADPWKQDRLFSWRAGGRMEEATFTRADLASYAALAGGGGFGTLTTAASGAARTHWMSTASSIGPRTFPALLLEEQRTNLVFPSENFASTLWVKTTVTLTSGQSDPRGGTNAFLISDASTTVEGTLKRNLTITASTRGTLTLHLRAGTTLPAGGHDLGLTKGTSGTSYFMRASITWSSGRPIVAISKGTQVQAPTLWRNRYYRIAIRSTGNLTTGVYRFTFSPAGVTAQKANAFIFGAQVEQ